MSSRLYRPQTLQVAHDFQATRCEWMYCSDPAAVAELRTVVDHVGLAAHPTLHIQNDGGAAHDINGNIIVAPWMTPGKTAWNTTFKDVTRRAITEMITSAIAIGADSVELDDPATDYGILAFAGGDFSLETVAAFRTYCASIELSRDAARELRADDFDIRRWIMRCNSASTEVDWAAFKKQHGSDAVWRLWTRFMERHTQRFVASMRTLAHSTGRGVPLSLNVNNPLPTPDKTFLLDQADYLISEINELHFPRQLIAYNACSAAWSLPFVPSVVPRSRSMTRWAIALGYAVGANPLVPWDVFVPHGPRYFGTAAEYGDLFSFVTANGSLFDAYESVVDVALIFAEASTTAEDVDRAMFICVSRGLSVRFVVLRVDGSVTGLHPGSWPTVAAISVNASLSLVATFFPNIPIVSLGNFLATNYVLPGTVRAVTPDPQRIVAIARRDRSQSRLLVHVIDARETEQALGDDDYVEVTLPIGYHHHFARRDHTALIVGLRGFTIRHRIFEARAKDEVVLRVPLKGIQGWGVAVLD